MTPESQAEVLGDLPPEFVARLYEVQQRNRQRIEPRVEAIRDVLDAYAAQEGVDLRSFSAGERLETVLNFGAPRHEINRAILFNVAVSLIESEAASIRGDIETIINRAREQSDRPSQLTDEKLDLILKAIEEQELNVAIGVNTTDPNTTVEVDTVNALLDVPLSQ